MDTIHLKQKLETLNCHIHGDAAYITVLKNDSIEIETCCLLFRHQLMLVAGKDENLVSKAEKV